MSLPIFNCPSPFSCALCSRSLKYIYVFGGIHPGASAQKQHDRQQPASPNQRHLNSIIIIILLSHYNIIITIIHLCKSVSVIFLVNLLRTRALVVHIVQQYKKLFTACMDHTIIECEYHTKGMSVIL